MMRRLLICQAIMAAIATIMYAAIMLAGAGFQVAAIVTPFGSIVVGFIAILAITDVINSSSCITMKELRVAAIYPALAATLVNLALPFPEIKTAAYFSAAIMMVFSIFNVGSNYLSFKKKIISSLGCLAEFGIVLSMFRLICLIFR